jgi:hypothetical protein
MCRESIYVAIVSFFTGVLGSILLTYGATAAKCAVGDPTLGMIAATILGAFLIFAYAIFSLITVISWRKNRLAEVTQHVTLSEERL